MYPNRRIGAPKQQWVKIASEEAWEEVGSIWDSFRGVRLCVENDEHIMALREWAGRGPREDVRVAGTGTNDSRDLSDNIGKDNIQSESIIGSSALHPASFVSGGNLLPWQDTINM